MNTNPLNAKRPTANDLVSAQEIGLLRTIAAHIIGFPLEKLSMREIALRYSSNGQPADHHNPPMPYDFVVKIVNGDLQKGSDDRMNVLHQRYLELKDELSNAITKEVYLQYVAEAHRLVPEVFKMLARKIEGITAEPGSKGAMAAVALSKEIREWVGTPDLRPPTDDSAVMMDFLRTNVAAPPPASPPVLQQGGGGLLNPPPKFVPPPESPFPDEAT